jgi:type II secretory pathway component PulF
MNRLMVGALGTIVAGFPGAVTALAVLELARRRPRPRPQPDAVVVAARLLVLVGAGLPLVAALEAAAGSEPEVAELVRRSRRLGTVGALTGAGGPLAPLLRRLADAASSGSPLEPTIRAFIEGERRRRHTRAVERARRLPVQLMIPMTLLVLPGFVVMVYGPAMIDMVLRLVGPLAP